MANITSIGDYANRALPTQIITQSDTTSQLLMIKTPMGIKTKTIKSDSIFNKKGLQECIDFIDYMVQDSKKYLLEERRKKEGEQL